MTLLTRMRFSILVSLFALMPAAAQNPQNPPPAKIVEGIELRGTSGVPEDVLKAAILSKVGAVYDEQALRRDVTALWNTNRFDDVQVSTEPGAHGGVIVRFVMAQPALASDVVEGIEFRGLSRVSP